MVSGQKRDAEIFDDAPRQGGLALGELRPEFRAGRGCVGKNQAEHFAAADQAVVPAEIVVEQEIEGGGLAGANGFDGALLNFRLQATAAEGAVNAAIGIKQGLRADFLRAGTFDAGNERERDRFAGARGVRQGLKYEMLHSACVLGIKIMPIGFNVQ